MTSEDDIDYADHDPEGPMSAEAEASLLAAIRNAPPQHPDSDYLRKFQPLDLRGAKDA